MRNRPVSSNTPPLPLYHLLFLPWLPYRFLNFLLIMFQSFSNLWSYFSTFFTFLLVFECSHFSTLYLILGILSSGWSNLLVMLSTVLYFDFLFFISSSFSFFQNLDFFVECYWLSHPGFELTFKFSQLHV